MNADHGRETSGVDWDRLSTLFEATMSLPTARRQAHIDALRGEEPMLCRELAELVAVADHAEAYFEELSHDVIAPVFEAALASVSGDNEAAAPASLPPLTRIRHYDVQECLGAGGMGVVYRGWDNKLARVVALKFVSPDRLIDPTSRLRLLREAQAASSLSDANVCAIHAIEDLTDGGICVIMGYCAGGTLRDRLRDGPLTVAEALAVATQVASGLASAHRRGIVHRDIKPANIGFDADGTARILDFGIAIRMGDRERTSGSPLAGSLPYLAPEQLRGVEPDARADVWALGVTLYEMLCGRRPFAEQPNVSLAYEILHAPTPALVRDDGVEIPGAVANLVAILLSNAPEDRPDSGAAVVTMLRDAVETTAPSARVAGNMSPAHTPRWPARRTTRAGALLLIGALLIAAVFTWQGNREADRFAEARDTPLEVARTSVPLPTLAVLPFSVEGGAELEYLRNGLVDLLTPAFDATGLVRGIDPNAVIGAASKPAGARWDSSSARALAAQIGASRYVVGNVVGVGNAVTIRATLYRASGEESGRAQLAVVDLADLSAGVDRLVYGLIATELRAPGDTVAGLAATTTNSAPALRAYLDGERELRDARPAAALAHFQRAVDMDSMFALAWYRLARAAKWSDVDSLNAQATERAYALIASLPLRLQDIVRGYHAFRFGNPSEAERILRQVTIDYPTDVDAWMMLGETRYQQNPYYGRPMDEARDAFHRVMALDPRNREVNVYLMDLAARAGRLGELDTLFRMYFSPNSAGEQPGIRQTYIALHARRVSADDSPDSFENRINDPTAARIALQRVQSDPRDLPAARAYAMVLSSSAAEPTLRLEGLLALATLDATDGRDTSALKWWQEADAIDVFATDMHRALLAIAPRVGVDSSRLIALRRALAAQPRIGLNPGETLSDSERDELRQYLIGLLSVRLREDAAVEVARRTLARAARSSRVAASLEAALRGHQALAAREYEKSARAFQESVTSVPIGVRRRYPVLEQHADRLARADALRAMGRQEEAARWYRSLLEGPAITAFPYATAARAGLDAVAVKSGR